MEQYTKDCPGCFHSAIKYLAALEGTAHHKQLSFDKLEQLYSTHKNKRPKLKFKSYDITVIDESGTPHPFMLDSKRFDFRGITAKSFTIETWKRFEDFKTKLERAGNYEDSLGGGWHQTVDMYKHNGNYFAMMDCAH